jgi:hypothetical protein
MMPIPTTGATLTADPRTALIAMLTAFACAHVLALIYVWSHRGVSYAQSFVQSLIMAPVACALMMLVIGSNVVLGIGMMGALALVRFRTNLRDTRDMMFVFMSLVTGIAAGTGAYMLAILGTAVFTLISVYLAKVAFGFRGYFDAILRFTLPSGDTTADACLKTHCSRVSLTMMQQVAQGLAAEHVYQIRFRNGESRQSLVRDLEKIEGLGNLSLMLEDARVDI